jgi:hypothetical protein
MPLTFFLAYLVKDTFILTLYNIYSMHKNGKPTAAEPPVSPRTPAQAFANSLGEELGGRNKIMKDLLALKRSLAGAGNPGSESMNAALNQVRDCLKSHGFGGQDENSDNFRVQGKRIDNAMMETLECVNRAESSLSILDEANLSETGTRVIKGRHTALIITDPDRREESSETIAKVVEVVKRVMDWINSTSTYTAHMVINGELVGMQINHGKHKGYLGVFCPEGEQEAVVYFKHFEHGQGKFSGNRITFVKKALAEYGLSVTAARRGIDSTDMRMLELVKLEDLDRVVETSVRLSRAVKDLDLRLMSGNQAHLAGMLFGAGVTNMIEFLDLLGTRRRSTDSPELPLLLAEYEKELLDRFIGDAEKLDLWADGIRERHSKLREAKDLNFSVLKQCTELQFAILDHVKEGQLVPKRVVERRFNAICCDLLRMARLCDGGVDSDEPGPFEQKAQALIEKYDRILSVCGWSLDESETGQLMGMFADKGGQPELDNVCTFEELVRLMHSQIILLPIWMVVDDNARDQRGKLILLDCYEPLPTGFVCLNLEKGVEAEDLKTYEILRKLLSGLSHYGDIKSVALVGADFADISMPQGKHYVELSADLDDKNECYTLRMRYFETQYFSAEIRNAYVMKVLNTLGFSVTRTGNVTEAAMRTQDRKNWATAYREVVRLMVSMKDLDMVSWEPETLARMFSYGYTYLVESGHADKDMTHAFLLHGDEAGASFYRKFMANPSLCDGDKTALTRRFAELFQFKPSKIMPILKDFSAKELDDIYEHLYDIEFAAKKAGDTKLSRKVVTLENKLEKLIGEKLPPKRDV